MSPARRAAGRQLPVPLLVASALLAWLTVNATGDAAARTRFLHLAVPVSVPAAGWVVLLTGILDYRGPVVRTVGDTGHLACAAVLVGVNPWFGLYAWTSYLVLGLLPQRAREPAIVPIALISAASQVGGYGIATRFWPGYLFIAAVNLGLAVAVHRATTYTIQQNQRLHVANGLLQAALAEKAGLHAQLVAQAREAGVQDERQRMAGEIHDTLAQGLAGIVTQLEVAEQARSDPARAADNRRQINTTAIDLVQAAGPVALTEKVSYAAWARRWGRQVSVFTPAQVMNAVARESSRAGGGLLKYPTWTTALSQHCVCGRRTKKPLRQRTHTCDCRWVNGQVLDRDLLAALLHHHAVVDHLDEAAGEVTYVFDPLLAQRLGELSERPGERLATAGPNLTHHSTRVPAPRPTLDRVGTGDRVAVTGPESTACVLPAVVEGEVPDHVDVVAGQQHRSSEGHVQVPGMAQAPRLTVIGATRNALPNRR